jgi:DUF1365 family protein
LNAWPDHVPAVTWHGRQGAVRHAFRYSVDYVLIDPEARRGPRLFSRNRLNLASVHDRDHGGAPGQGAGSAWAREVLAARGLPNPDACRILLLTQPRFLGYVFNPVSFWLVQRGEALVAVIAEVSNTYGDRHSYLCNRPEFAPIGAGDSTSASKLLHVSPFLEVAGGYEFAFDIRPDRIAIRIALSGGPDGLVATLAGERRRLTSGAILVAAVRRPFGALRTIALIHWEALRLKLKGAPYRRRPVPPVEEIT